MIHTPTLLLISLAINLMSALLMLFIHFLKPGRRNFLFWSLSAFLFSLSILLLSLGIGSGHPALGIRVGGLVSLMSILLLLAGFYALYGLSWRPRTLWGGVALLLLAYLGLSSRFEVRPDGIGGLPLVRLPDCLPQPAPEAGAPCRRCHLSAAFHHTAEPGVAALAGA